MFVSRNWILHGLSFVGRPGISWRLLAAALFFVAATAFGGSAEDGLSVEGQQLLRVMDQNTAAKALELASKATQWRDRIAKLKNQAQTLGDEVEAQGNDAEADNIGKVILEVAETLRAVSQLSPEMADCLKGTGEIETIIKKAEGQWTSATFDPKVYIDLDEASFREEAKEVAMAAAASEIMPILEGQLLAKVEQLKDPAEYIREFMEKKLKEEFLDKPYPVGDITFYFLQADRSKSLFSEDADIRIRIQYQAIDFPVEATGLYFEYDPNNHWLPIPNFDNVRPQDDWKEKLLAMSVLSIAGEGMPDLGLEFVAPKNVRFTPFKKGDPRSGALTLDLEVSLVKFIDGLMGTVKDITIYPSGKVDFNGVVVKLPRDPEIPIGTTGLVFAGVDGGVNKKRDGDGFEFLAGTRISVPQGREALALVVKISFDLPLKKVGVEGDLVMANELLKIGHVKGELTREYVSADLEIPSTDSNLSLDSIGGLKLKFRMDGKGLTAEGWYSLFSIIDVHAKLIANYDGSASLSGEAAIDALLINWKTTVKVTLDKGFKNLRVVARTSLDLDLAGVFSAEVAMVKITITDGGDPLLHVHARALGIASVGFGFNSLDVDVPAEVRRRLKDKTPWAVQVLLDNLKEWDIFNKNSGIRNTLASLDVFNKNSTAGKFFRDAGCLKNYDPFNKNSGLRQGLRDADILTNPDSRRKAGEWLGDRTGIRFGLHEPISTSSPEFRFAGYAVADERVPFEKDVTKRLSELANKIDQVKIIKRPETELRNGKNSAYLERRELFVKLANCAVAPAEGGEKDAILAFVVRHNGYQWLVNDRSVKASKDEDGSEVKWASIRVKNFKSEGGRRPNVEFELPKLSDYSGLPVSELVHDRLLDLIETFLPEADIEGRRRFYQKQLRIENKTEETITVWIQRRTRKRIADSYRHEWTWTPGKPGSSEAAQITIEPKKTELLSASFDVNLGPFGGKKEITVPFAASRVRIWAESESGERWMRYKDKDLWIVSRNPRMANERRYYAEKIATHTYVIEPKSGGRIYSERLVRLTNKTKEPLSVQLSYRANEGGETKWRRLKSFEIPAGASGNAKTTAGMKLRASQVRFEAESEHFRFRAYTKEPLYLVKETDDHRNYFAEKIGQFEYVFEPPEATSSKSSKAEK